MLNKKITERQKQVDDLIKTQKIINMVLDGLLDAFEAQNQRLEKIENKLPKRTDFPGSCEKKSN